jgi:probable phosphoglycerate mutase
MPVLYLVRHGETDWNVEQRLQGHIDTGLNARGRQQAAHCGDLLHDLFERDQRQAQDLAYVSSPLNRARETMERMRATLGLDPHGYGTDDRLREVSYGQWEGLTLPEIQAREPGVLMRREQDKWDFRPPDGESYRDLTRRVSGWHASVTRDTVVAAHGGVARALMAYLGLMPDEEATHADVVHGVVYVFSAGTMARYA